MYTHTNRLHNYFTLLHMRGSTLPYQTECQLHRTHLALVHVVATVTGSKFKIGGDSDVYCFRDISYRCFVCDFFLKPFYDRHSPVPRRD